MLEVQPTGQRGRMAMKSGQKVLDAKKTNVVVVSVSQTKPVSSDVATYC